MSNISKIIKKTFEEENDQINSNKFYKFNIKWFTCISIINTPMKLILINLSESMVIMGKSIINNWYGYNLLIRQKDNISSKSFESIKLIIILIIIIMIL